MRRHLRRPIQVGSAEAERATARRRECFAESEIGQFRGGGGEEEIFGLDVAMENVLCVEFADGDDEGGGDGAERGVRFGERHGGLDAEEGVSGAAERRMGQRGEMGGGSVLEEGEGFGFGLGDEEGWWVGERGVRRDDGRIGIGVVVGSDSVVVIDDIIIDCFVVIDDIIIDCFVVIDSVVVIDNIIMTDSLIRTIHHIMIDCLLLTIHILTDNTTIIMNAIT